MLCKKCLSVYDVHEGYFDYRFCPHQVDTPVEIMEIYQPMTNLEYLEYQYEKTQVIR